MCFLLSLELTNVLSTMNRTSSSSETKSESESKIDENSSTVERTSVQVMCAYFFTIVYCPFPGFIENGRILLVGHMGMYDYRPYVKKVTNKKQIVFECDKGYFVSGAPGATCIDGSWSPKTLPQCIRGSHPVFNWFQRRRKRSSFDQLNVNNDTIVIQNYPQHANVFPRYTSIMASNNLHLNTSTSLYSNSVTHAITQTSSSFNDEKTTESSNHTGHGNNIQNNQNTVSKLNTRNNNSPVSTLTSGVIIRDSTNNSRFTRATFTQGNQLWRTVRGKKLLRPKGQLYIYFTSYLAPVTIHSSLLPVFRFRFTFFFFSLFFYPLVSQKCKLIASMLHVFLIFSSPFLSLCVYILIHLVCLFHFVHVKCISQVVSYNHFIFILTFTFVRLFYLYSFTHHSQ